MRLEGEIGSNDSFYLFPETIREYLGWLQLIYYINRSSLAENFSFQIRDEDLHRTYIRFTDVRKSQIKEVLTSSLGYNIHDEPPEITEARRLLYEAEKQLFYARYRKSDSSS